MCGIFGYARLKENETMSGEDLNIAVQFLTLDNITRGRDSTGIATIDNSGTPFVLRKVKDADDFLKSKFVLKMLDANINRETRQIFGHTRQATTGKVNLVNAQPFIYGPILGTHNGIINNYRKLFKKAKLRPETSCDSEVIFALLSQKESLADKGAALERLKGYFSIAFHDARFPEKIYFARGNNVLSIYASPDKSFIFWSSQAYPINEIVDYFNLELEEIKIDDGELIAINPDGTIERQILSLPGRYDYFSGGTNTARDAFFGHSDFSRPMNTQDDDFGFYWTNCALCNRQKECTYSYEFAMDLCWECSLTAEHRYGIQGKHHFKELYDDGLLD